MLWNRAPGYTLRLCWKWMFGLRFISGTSAELWWVRCLHPVCLHWKFWVLLKKQSCSVCLTWNSDKQEFLTWNRWRTPSKKYIPANTFESLKIPLHVTATDIKSGETVYFSEGILSTPLMASACVPFVFKPIQYQNKLLLDGGILNNCPVEPIAGTCDILIGSHVNSISTNIEHLKMKDIVDRSFHFALNHSVYSKVNQLNLFLILLTWAGFAMFEMNNADDIFSFAYDYAKKVKGEEIKHYNERVENAWIIHDFPPRFNWQKELQIKFQRFRDVFFRSDSITVQIKSEYTNTATLVVFLFELFGMNGSDTISFQHHPYQVFAGRIAKKLIQSVRIISKHSVEIFVNMKHLSGCIGCPCWSSKCATTFAPAGLPVGLSQFQIPNPSIVNCRMTAVEAE